VRELVDRYLYWIASDRNVARLRRLAAARIEPAISLEYAALVDAALINGLLKRLRTEGAEDDEIRARTVVCRPPTPGHVVASGRESTHCAS
jgi:hypothetical protein